MSEWERAAVLACVFTMTMVLIVVGTYLTLE